MRLKVAVVVENNNNQILLIKEYSEGKKGYFWNVIKGTYGNSDLIETLDECAIREAKEEAGANIEIIGLINCLVKPEKGPKIQFNFLGKANSILGKKKNNIQGEDVAEVKWFKPEEVKLIDKNDFISKDSFDLVHLWLSRKMKIIKLEDFIG